MLCDRCPGNGHCKRFRPGGECVFERERFRWLVERLVGDYSLSGIADRVLAERAAMYLIRIGRAENFECQLGFSDRAVAWGNYIASLDRMLRAILGELAVTRGKRALLEGEKALMVDVEGLLRRLKVGQGEGKVSGKTFKGAPFERFGKMAVKEAKLRSEIFGGLLREWLKARR